MEPPKQQRFHDLTRKDLREHLAFAARSLDPDGAAEVTIEPGIGPIPIWNRVFDTKPPEIEIQFSAGHLGRDQIRSLKELFEAADIDFTERYTRSRKEISRLLVRCSTADKLEAIAASSTLILAAEALGAPTPLKFSVYHRGRFRDEYRLTGEDPLEPATSFTFGYRLGRIVGSLWRALGFGRDSTKRP